jgi:hypothetical protein
VVKRKWKLEKGEELNGVTFAFFFPKKMLIYNCTGFFIVATVRKFTRKKTTTIDTT